MKNTHGTTMPFSNIQGKFDLARVYVVRQIYNTTFSLEESLRKGTIFPELYKPYKEKGRDK